VCLSPPSPASPDSHGHSSPVRIATWHSWSVRPRRKRRGPDAWSKGHTKGARAYRTIGLTAMAVAVILFLNAGIFPNRNSQSSTPGSQSEAIVNGVLLLLAIAFVWFFKIRRKLSGTSRRRWPSPDIPYDEWFKGNWIRPGILVMMLAELRALTHFSGSGLAVPIQATVYVAAGLSVIYLFVVGPLFRPQTLLSSVGACDRDGTLSVSEHALNPPNAQAPITPMEIRKMTFPKMLRGYQRHEVESMLNAIATRIEHGESISATELNEAHFPLSFNGYEVQNVDAFLDRLGRSLGRPLSPGT
jgi:DivIVA domain-containing protein